MSARRHAGGPKRFYVGWRMRKGTRHTVFVVVYIFARPFAYVRNMFSRRVHSVALMCKEDDALVGAAGDAGDAVLLRRPLSSRARYCETCEAVKRDGPGLSLCVREYSCITCCVIFALLAFSLHCCFAWYCILTWRRLGRACSPTCDCVPLGFVRAANIRRAVLTARTNNSVVLSFLAPLLNCLDFVSVA